MRISEVYTSIQGEGPKVGRPVQFIRFAGCNLRCPAWPCDTQHAIDPAYRNEWKTVETEELLEMVRLGPTEIVYTGGEPFLQPKDELEDLTRALIDKGYNIEAFTNGTLTWPGWTRGLVSMVMDWKLTGSGEASEVPKRLENVRSMTGVDSIKFTVASKADFEQAKRLWELARDMWPPALYGPRVYVGAVWDKVTEADVANWLMESRLPWLLNVQVHNHIWNREQRGI